MNAIERKRGAGTARATFCERGDWQKESSSRGQKTKNIRLGLLKVILWCWPSKWTFKNNFLGGFLRNLNLHSPNNMEGSVQINIRDGNFEDQCRHFLLKWCILPCGEVLLSVPTVLKVRHVDTCWILWNPIVMSYPSYPNQYMVKHQVPVCFATLWCLV